MPLHLKQERDAYCSTMLDYYGLGAGFPGTPVPANISTVEKAIRIEEAMKAGHLSVKSPQLRPDVRFLPYNQLHGYETLLFSDRISFAMGISQPGFANPFQRIRDSAPTPEDINDSPLTAPAKRLIAFYPKYRKVLYGTTGAHAVDIAAMRRECPHFRTWLEPFERLSAE